MKLNLKGRPMAASEPRSVEDARPAEAFIGNKTRHAVKCLDQSLDLMEEAYRCFIDCARELRGHANTINQFRNKVLDVIGPEPAPPTAVVVDTAQLEAEIADAALLGRTSDVGSSQQD